MKRKYVLWIAAIAGLLLIFIVAAPLLYIDDWSRDLTTNRAATSEDHKRPELRNIHSDLPPGELAEIVHTVGAGLSGWQEVESGVPDEIHFTRTTAIMGFVDDIKVTIQPDGDGSELSAVSQSRKGRGDLGQNPRNLKQLLDAVRAKLK